MQTGYAEAGRLHISGYNHRLYGVSLAGWPVACLKHWKIRSIQAPRRNASPPKGQIMVVIRLSRGGSKARPFFNIVVADKRVRRDGRFIERLGFYNPIATANEESIRVAQDRLSYWLGVGAQASPTVERLIKQAAKKAA
jgi:small subunit ribosomal protein S16